MGLNLDGYCTEPPVPRGECVPPNPDATLLLDGDQGIDNAFGKELIPLVKLAMPELAPGADTSGERGDGVVVFRVRGYNGEPNDDRVDVTMSQSVDGFAGTPDQMSPPPYTVVDNEAYDPAMTGPLPPPLWEGSDWLLLRADTFLSNDLERPRVRDDNAYVAEGLLVITLPDRVEIRFAEDDRGITVRVSDAHAIGQLNADGTLLESVVFVGRWSVTDLMQTMTSLGICEGDPQFSIFTNLLDTAADVRSRPGTGGTDVPCDALSLAVTFSGFTARIAGITEGENPPDLCAMR